MSEIITFSFSPSFFSLPDTIPAKFDEMLGSCFSKLVKPVKAIMQGGEEGENTLGKSLKERQCLSVDKQLNPLAQWSENALFYEIKGGIFGKPYSNYYQLDKEKRANEILEPFNEKNIPPDESIFAVAIFHQNMGFLGNLFGGIRGLASSILLNQSSMKNYISTGNDSSSKTVTGYDPASGDITINNTIYSNDVGFLLLEAECILNPRACTIRFNKVDLRFKENDLREDELEKIKKRFPVDQNNIIHFTAPEIQRAEQWIKEVHDLTNSDACKNYQDGKKVIAEVVASAESLIKDMPTCLSPKGNFQIERFKNAIDAAKKLPIVGNVSLWKNVVSVFLCLIPNIVNYFATDCKQFWMRNKTAIEKIPKILEDDKNYRP